MFRFCCSACEDRYFARVGCVRLVPLKINCSCMLMLQLAPSATLATGAAHVNAVGRVTSPMVTAPGLA